MFQQMQEMVRLNEPLKREFSRSGGRDIDDDCSEKPAVDERERENGRLQINRLQMIIVQQANEIEALRRKQRDATADGRMRPTALDFFDNQHDGDDGALRIDSPVGENATDSDAIDAADKALDDCRPATKRHNSQLRRLPLTSLHAQLKGKDLQLQRFEQIITKLQARFEQLVDRKRLMAQSFQQTVRTQQAHLKRYLSYIRQQSEEKKALERQVRGLNEYISVLEKKVVSSCSNRSRHSDRLHNTAR